MTPTNDLDELLQELLAAEPADLQEGLIKEILKELWSREPDPTPEQMEMAKTIYEDICMKRDLEAEIKLTPSFHGKECLGNGEWPGYECCCDECSYYLTCFPKFGQI